MGFAVGRGVGLADGRGVGLPDRVALSSVRGRLSRLVGRDEPFGPFGCAGPWAGAWTAVGRCTILPKQPGQFVWVGATRVPHCGQRVAPADPEVEPDGAVFE